MGRRLVLAAALVALAAVTDTSPAWALWGCGATGSGAVSRNDKEPSEVAARRDALHDCRAVGGRNCHIISCRPDVDTAEQATALWPSRGPNTFQCGPAYGVKCPK